MKFALAALPPIEISPFSVHRRQEYVAERDGGGGRARKDGRAPDKNARAFAFALIAGDVLERRVRGEASLLPMQSVKYRRYEVSTFRNCSPDRTKLLSAGIDVPDPACPVHFNVSALHNVHVRARHN